MWVPDNFIPWCGSRITIYPDVGLNTYFSLTPNVGTKAMHKSLKYIILSKFSYKRFLQFPSATRLRPNHRMPSLSHRDARPRVASPPRDISACRRARLGGPTRHAPGDRCDRLPPRRGTSALADELGWEAPWDMPRETDATGSSPPRDNSPFVELSPLLPPMPPPPPGDS